MIREDRFLISRRPYAVNLASYDGPTATVYPTGTWYGGSVDAVWFRRRNGQTVACIGTLNSSTRGIEPKTAQEFLALYTDGRYGGDCFGRWDGESYWGNVTLDVQQQHLAILQPMLANYPAVPAGYDGWYRF